MPTALAGNSAARHAARIGRNVRSKWTRADAAQPRGMRVRARATKESLTHSLATLRREQVRRPYMRHRSSRAAVIA